jgi:glycosyltransferase involved in cell wall biosynthesis
VNNYSSFFKSTNRKIEDIILSTPILNENSSETLITFFVPCFNEEKNIECTLNVIKEAAAEVKYEVIVVDDGSTDLTSATIERYIKNNQDLTIKLIKRVQNVGLGTNYFESAIVACGTYFMLVNGDNVEPVETIKAIISKVGQADMVIPNFGKLDKRKWNRRLLSILFTTIVNFISGNRIGYYNGPVLHLRENILKVRIDSFGYGYQAEILCKLLQSRATYIEVVVSNGDREWGASKAFAPKNFLSVASSLITILFNRIRT